MATVPLPTTPAERFAAIIEFLCRAVAARAAEAQRPNFSSLAARLTAPLFCLAWSRLRRAAPRFAHLAARIRPGAPPRPHIRRALPAAARPAPAGPAAASTGPRRSWERLPRRVGWLLPIVPAARPGANYLGLLLADPEVAALLAASPGLRRLLRPLCRMLAVVPPPAPAPPPPPPTPPPPTPPSPAPPSSAPPSPTPRPIHPPARRARAPSPARRPDPGSDPG